MLKRWLQTAHVKRWWGDPDEQIALLEQDLSDPRMVMQIVFFENQPFAYAQDYSVQAWPQAHLKHLPDSARAIDSFIGVEAMHGRGHGAKFLRQRANELCEAGAPAVIVDPDPENFLARQAYRNAGFVGESISDSDEGPCVLMTFKSS